jgi:hypothetical protein
MMFDTSVKLHRRVRIMMDGLSEAEQRAVLHAVEALQQLPVEQWPPETVEPLEGLESRYLVRVPTDWRIVIARDPDGQIEILDIMQAEFLRMLREQSKNGAVPG